MTRSGPNNNRPPRGPRVPQWLADAASVAWDILRAAEYAEMRRESERQIRQKIQDEARLRRLMEQNLGQEIEDGIKDYIKEKLSKVIENTKDKSIKQIEDKLKSSKIKLSNKIKGKLRAEQRELNDKVNKGLEETQNKIEEEAQQKFKKAKDELKKLQKNLENEIEQEVTEAIRQQLLSLKAYRSMESQLRKVQAIAISVPAIIIGFSVFFRDKISDFMSINVLHAEIKHLQEDVKALQPSRGQGIRQPWEEPPLPPWGKEP